MPHKIQRLVFLWNKVQKVEWHLAMLFVQTQIFAVQINKFLRLIVPKDERIWWFFEPWQKMLPLKQTETPT